jgi:membrane associated rhomboid family serine protease
MARLKSWQRNLTFGGRVPWSVGLLMSLTVVLSLVSAFGDRHAGPVFAFLALCPALVWAGQLWRLVTWVFVEPSPLGLIFGCLSLYWFGAPLAKVWGSRRFFTVVAGVMLGTAVGTCLVGLLDGAVAGATYLGGWALTTALVVAWGLWFPDQVVRIYFFLPVRGYWMAWITVGLTAVFAIYRGWASLLPELLAEAGILAWLFRRSILSRLTHVRQAVDAARPKGGRRPERGVVVDLRSGDRLDGRNGRDDGAGKPN